MTLKTCRVCGVEKSFEHFYIDHKSKDGLNTLCRACRRARDVETKRDPNRVARMKLARKAWIERNPEKYKAQQAAQRAIKKGQLKRGPCEICGSSKAHAHHDDYAKVLEVRWLCSVHHVEYHRGRPNQ